MTRETAILLAVWVVSALALAALVLMLAWRRLIACLLAGLALAMPAASPPGPVACLDASLCAGGSGGSGGSPPHPPMAQ